MQPCCINKPQKVMKKIEERTVNETHKYKKPKYYLKHIEIYINNITHITHFPTKTHTHYIHYTTYIS